MSEWKLFTDDVAFVSTAKFHEHRERAPHLEQPVHRDRLLRARDFVLDAASRVVGISRLIGAGPVAAVDLGCGDGGLLQLLRDTRVLAHGYDFQPSNVAGWTERGVHAWPLDVFGGDDTISAGAVLDEIVVMTEVLEHLTRPHDVLQVLANHPNVRFVIASSPHTESDISHDECHAWAWDIDGYVTMFTDAGFTIHRHETVGMFQVILAEVV